MSQSHKHHYLPEFYLKGFTNDNGRLSIYDCKKKHIKKGEYAPSTHFREEKRNTIKIEDDETDFLEEFYSLLDNRHSELLQYIQKSNKCPELSQEQMMMLQEFVLATFWRLPKNDEYYTNEFSKDPIFTKAFKIIKKDTGLEVENDETKKIKSSEAFIKGVRGLAQFTSILAATKSFDFNNWRITYHPTGLNICSDNPIIVRDDTVKNILETDFIIPLTKHHLLIRTLKTVPIKSTPNELKAIILMLISLQGTIYCAGPNREHLKAISSLTEKINSNNGRNKIASQINQIFNFLENPPQDCL